MLDKGLKSIIKNEEAMLEAFEEAFPVRSVNFNALVKYYISSLSETEFNSLLEVFVRISKSFKNTLSTVPQGPQRTKLSHDLMNKQIASNDTSSVSCKKGCAHCCHYKVIVTDDEAEYLASLIKDNKIKMQGKHLKKQAKAVSETGRRPPTTLKASRCVFLNGENSCSVYEHRPMNCRKALVTNGPEACATPGSNDQGPLVIPEAEILLATVMEMCGDSEGPLSVKLYEKLKDFPELIED